MYTVAGTENNVRPNLDNAIMTDSSKLDISPVVNLTLCLVGIDFEDDGLVIREDCKTVGLKPREASDLISGA